MEVRHQREKSLNALGNELHRVEDKYNDYEYPKVSIIVPTLNCSEQVPQTFESILVQNYPNYEIIVVDGGSTDRTLEAIKSYRDSKIRVYSVSGFRYEMMNKGISQAKGTYLNFLFPGDFYIYQETLKYMMGLALGHGQPELVYCGTLIRDGKSEVKILFRELSLKLLKNGQQPTSLQSCWFKIETFKALGKFNINYRLRGGYELMCRFCLHKGLRSVSTKRVLTDYDLRLVTKWMVFRHFMETFKTIRRYFGIFHTIRWLFKQKDCYRFAKLWMRSLRVAILGK